MDVSVIVQLQVMNICLITESMPQKPMQQVMFFIIRMFKEVKQLLGQLHDPCLVSMTMRQSGKYLLLTVTPTKLNTKKFKVLYITTTSMRIFKK